MKSKKQPSKKVLDISRPKKRANPADVPSAPQLVIPKRAIIVSDDPESEKNPPVNTSQVQPKQVAKDIEPQNGPAPAKPAPEPPAAKPEVPESAPEPASAPEPEEKTKPEPEEASPTPEPSAPEKPTEPEEEPAQEPEEPESEPEVEAEDAGEDAKSGKANPHVRKALEDAKREQELQGYINNREFFVPINAVARKRSVKVSILLAFVELLLGLFLLNLMLDAGLIYLLEKIPHTNFFDLQ